MDKYLVKRKKADAEESEPDEQAETEEQPKKKQKVEESAEEAKDKEKAVVKDTNTFNDLETYLTDDSWNKLVGAEFKKDYFNKLKKYLTGELDNKKVIYPAKQDVFAAFNHCSFDNLKVVILGQDPYQTPKFAHGLAFSVQPGIQVPKSLANIYKELGTDIRGFKAPKSGTLTKWADQGVLLLNTVMTVEHDKSNAHKKQGWEKFTDEVIKLINSKKSHVVFMLWGKPSQEKKKMITASKHLVLEAAHPSPLSASKGFFGCKHFSKCNEYLEKNGEKAIDWSL
jgi:uracil-DNA glycosylase